MQWSATDQFGNLYIGESSAKTLEELAPEVASLVEEVHARAGGAFVITVDMEYSELNGPDPDRVSHILRVPDLASFPREDITRLVEEACAQQGIEGVTVNSPGS